MRRESNSDTGANESSGLMIRNIKVLNPVAWVFSIGGSDVEMRNVYIDARSNDAYPFNTGMYRISHILCENKGQEYHIDSDWKKTASISPLPTSSSTHSKSTTVMTLSTFLLPLKTSQCVTLSHPVPTASLSPAPRAQAVTIRSKMRIFMILSWQRDLRVDWGKVVT